MRGVNAGHIEPYFSKFLAEITAAAADIKKCSPRNISAGLYFQYSRKIGKPYGIDEIAQLNGGAV